MKFLRGNCLSANMQIKDHHDHLHLLKFSHEILMLFALIPWQMIHVLFASIQLTGLELIHL